MINLSCSLFTDYLTTETILCIKGYTPSILDTKSLE